MAIWQFKFSLVPAENVVRLHGERPETLEQYQALTLPEYDPDAVFQNYWAGRDPRALAPEVLTLLPEASSWSDEARMFGSDEGDWLELWDQDVNCRIDVPNFSKSYAQGLVDLAERHGCLLAISPTGELIDPDLGGLCDQIMRSRAYHFCSNPKEAIVAAAEALSGRS